MKTKIINSCTRCNQIIDIKGKHICKDIIVEKRIRNLLSYGFDRKIITYFLGV